MPWSAATGCEPETDVLSIELKRVYEPMDAEDGARVLVDRLWPRGISKERAGLTAWIAGAAPSLELRRWFDHDPAKWEEFKRRYFAELGQATEAVRSLVSIAGTGTITLVYASRNEEINNAVALREYLMAQASEWS